MSVHAFPRQRWHRTEPELRRRVDAWRRKKVRRRLAAAAALRAAVVFCWLALTVLAVWIASE